MTHTPDQPRDLRQVPGLVQPTGAERIAAERLRQITDEGYDPEHDEAFVDASLATAAACYALPHSMRRFRRVGNMLDAPSVPTLWPWRVGDWKSGDDRVRELVQAGALIAAEIDRLLRAEVTDAPAHQLPTADDAHYAGTD